MDDTSNTLKSNINVSKLDLESQPRKAVQQQQVQQQQTTVHSNGTNNDNGDNADDNDKPTAIIDEDELEQTAYKARLAKLILLSRTKKKVSNFVTHHTDIDVTKGKKEVVIDYTPKLAFHGVNNDNDKEIDQEKEGNSQISSSFSSHVGDKDISNIAQSTIGNSKNDNKREASTSTLKSMLRKKQMKVSNRSKEYELNDDSYWS